MIAEQFKKYWNEHFSDSEPIDYELKRTLNDRWFRIHYLPDSKRYADSESEYETISLRQNTIIDSLFQSDKEFLIVLGFFKYDLNEQLSDEYFNLSEFQHVDTLDLHEIRPEEYADRDTYYDIFIRKEDWVLNGFDTLLRRIADGEDRAMFVNTYNNIVIIPYDGGMDIILADKETRDKLKVKYSDWLSPREDGL